MQRSVRRSFILTNEDCGGEKIVVILRPYSHITHSKMNILLFCLAAAGLHTPAALPVETADSLWNFDINEAVVVASPKETSLLERQPVSVSLYNRNELDALGVRAVKDLAAYAPNFFQPDYGSRLTSAIYIRGIGSRINTPAVGLYVDNVPYTDKSAYDFSFIDVERVDVLRGPQGTLYGRNSMGGLVRVFTADPLARSGTDIRLGASTRSGGKQAKAVTYLHPSERTGVSVGTFYEGREGYYRNTTTGRHADGADAAGGKVRAAWRPTDALRMDLTVSYEYSDEGACPYFELAAQPVAITQNRPSTYRRQLLNTGLGIEWKRPQFVLSSITAYQRLDDRLFMDQDFTAADIFSLTQRQRLNAVTEEISLKSPRGRRWQWTTGAFVSYQDMTTRCPVGFYTEGVDYINSMMDGVFAGLSEKYPQMPPMGLALTGDGFEFGSRLETPSANAALFHQSTVNDLFTRGLSLTVGLRLDYEHRRLDLASGSTAPIGSQFWIGSPAAARPLDGVDARLDGKRHDESWQLLPKVALQYEHLSGRGNVYVAVSKGYRSGGYNIQSYSDLSQQLLRRQLMLAAIPEAMRGMLEEYIPAEPDVAELAYKPEQSWNYEVGGHLKSLDRRFRLDYTFFYMNTKDQQLARFSESGMGRVMVNAGKSRSWGAELTLRASLLDRRLNLSAAYGFTRATFTDYDLGTTEGVSADYSGNRVPFAPEHTLGALASFTQPLRGRFLRSVGASLHATGAGRIYWDEANTFSQPFYATLDARLSAELAGGVSVELWGSNLTATRYSAFAFESLERRFAQLGAPRRFGLDVSLHF